MKHTLISLSLIMFTVGIYAASPRDADWKKVEEAMQQGLPKTAIEVIEPIITASLKDKAWAEATKAICRKIALEGQIQGEKAEEKIVRLEAEIAKAPAEIKPLLQTVLANWYWQYFQQNRWRFMQRTATAQAPGKDFTTWDLQRLFAEINRHFTAALAADQQLKAVPITQFDDLLTKGSLPDTYRPTLYDFIAHEALKFYTGGEQAGARPQDSFHVTAEGPIFDAAPQFLAWKPSTTETNAAALKAIQVFQALLRFHEKESDQAAFLDADLARLTWGRNVAAGESKQARYVAALQRFAAQNGDHELAATALHEWANQLWEQGDPSEARTVAQRGRNAHPNSSGGKLCANLIARIEAKSANIATERIWNAPWPDITVTYRNVTNVWFRAIEWNWDEFLDRQHRRPENLNDAERKAVLAKTPALAWSHPLPPTADFKEHMAKRPAPATLKPGFYFLVASHNPDFSDGDNQLSMTDVWVSNLALVIRKREGNVEGFVLEALSGEPIASARVEGWHLNNQGNRVAVPAVMTDSDGSFTIATPNDRGVLIKATARGQSVATVDEYQRWRPERDPKPFTQTIFFTDRAIYRPGQTIQYKGICLRADQGADNYDVLKGQRLTVVFYDPNNKEVARQEHRANDYGSFSGSFTAPRDRLMGAMRLAVINGPDGGTALSVEEYKRPKFQVALEAPKVAAKLNGEVTVPGHATAYTGAAIDDAEVKYRVVRQVRMPWWWGWGWRRGGWPQQDSQEIANGSLRTGVDGRFEIAFMAKPDPEVPEADEPTFEFEVYADVTDGAGETRSDARTIRLGYTALEARLSTPSWLTADAAIRIEVHTTTLDGEPQVAEGSVKIHALVPPENVQRTPLSDPNRPWLRHGGGDSANFADAAPDLSDVNNWPLGAVVAERGFTTDTNGLAELQFKLPAGAYRAVLETQDRFGKKVTGRLPLQVVSPGADKFAIRIPHFLDAPAWELQPGNEFIALWGTGYESGRAFVEIQHRGKLLQRYWTRPGVTQAPIKQAVTEAMRGGFTLLVTFVRENRAELTTREISVPWRNQELSLRWEHFTSKLHPGQKETWTLEVQSPKPEAPSAEYVIAELVATLYDASLDAFAPLSWTDQFGVFRQEQADVSVWFGNSPRGFQVFRHNWSVPQVAVERGYREFPPDLQNAFLSTRMMRYGRAARGGVGGMPTETMLAAPAAAAVPLALADSGGEVMEKMIVTGSALAQEGPAMKAVTPIPAQADGSPARGPDLSKIAARKNLNETAFFFPHLLSDSNGTVRLQFTMPEALTEWRFLGFAHDRQLRAGLLTGKAVTAKDLMVQPNPPRFLREGDVIEFTVKVSNQSDQAQRGKVRLTFNNGMTDQSADALLANKTPEQVFNIPARESRSFAWRIRVPDGLSIITYKAVAATDTLSDGEEGFVPVLSRRILVTESLPLPIRGPATKKFAFKSLADSGKSKTLTHQSLTVQMVSQPAWYAVMALPYLMEFPHECSEQTFNRYYANTLARFIANSDPKIRRVFDLWKGTPALDSPLEKNQDLKSVMLEESPWLQQALDESQARKNVGVLFDDNRLTSEMERALAKLREAALPEGGWSWFPGGPRNEYITLYLVTGFGRLRQLGADVPTDLAQQSLDHLDAWMVEHHARILKDYKVPDDYVPSSTDALYLYGRSFFLKDKPIAPNHQPAMDFFLARAREHWLKTGNRQTQGHLALALNRLGHAAAAQAIVKSLKERSVTSEELGRFWRDTELSWWWYQAPIETQALMIEVFAEVANDAQAVEDCQVWLLKQKQTQNWKTTKATADAVYALLLRGRNLLAGDKLVELTVGGVNVTPGAAPQSAIRDPQPKVEPGTGFYEVRFAGPAVKPKQGEFSVKKVDAGVAWGSAHWQYFEDMTKVKPYEGTPLKLKKTLFTKKNTPSGPVIEAVKGQVAVGDELVVRIELRVDRDMEYVHLKDQRGSGTEPVSVLSSYRYQDGLGYYESTRDTASHFFIAYLPKGTYVFEYSTRVQLRGEYQTGLASIQCMYAPEFNSHSESLKILVK